MAQHLLTRARSKVLVVWSRFRYSNPRFLWLFKFYARTVLRPTRRRRNEQSAEFIDCPTTYINLKGRPDRARQTQQEFKRLGMRNVVRFEAVDLPNRSLGAASSHHRILSTFLEERLTSPALICEDDVEFLADASELQRIYAEFVDDPRLDVLCLAFLIKNTVKDRLLAPWGISEHLMISNEVVTQACYVVKPSALVPLVKSLNRSKRLLELGVPWHLAAGDVLWQSLQQGRLTFAIPRDRVVRQRAGFSDIYGVYKDIPV